jgi:peptide/nickel transport system permease protein
MMRSYLGRRLLQSIPIVLGVTLLTFLLFHAFGGDPVATFLGKNASADEIARFRHEYGLDRPLWEQYLSYLAQIARLDLGRSFVTREPVIDMLLKGAGPSLCLTVPALLIMSVLSMGVSLVAAHHRNRPLDRILVALMVAGMSMSFLFYIVVGQYLLAFSWPLFHIHGFESGWVARWPYLALPIVILVVVGVGYDTRFYRSVLVEEMDKEYVTTARAKGLSPLSVMLHHVLPNALIPIVTRIMISVPFLVTGSLLLESFFGIPGLGGTLLEALDRADSPVIKAYTVLISLVFVLSNLLTDLLYAIVDPRVRLS